MKFKNNIQTNVYKEWYYSKQKMQSLSHDVRKRMDCFEIIVSEAICIPKED